MNKRIIKVLVAFVLVIISTCNISIYASTEIYTVKKGDTLWLIAQRYEVGIKEIINANAQFENPNLIYPGDKVYIPLQNAETKSFEQQVADLVNKERAAYGLKPLKINWQVSRVARIKSEDMRDHNYFGHNSAIYGSPFDMLKKYNITFSSAGENIAKGQSTPESVMRSWMSSEGHRKNILSSDYTEIGVGFAKNSSSTYWTQMFIR